MSTDIDETNETTETTNPSEPTEVAEAPADSGEGLSNEQLLALLESRGISVTKAEPEAAPTVEVPLDLQVQAAVEAYAANASDANLRRVQNLSSKLAAQRQADRASRIEEAAADFRNNIEFPNFGVDGAVRVTLTLNYQDGELVELNLQAADPTKVPAAKAVRKSSAASGREVRYDRRWPVGTQRFHTFASGEVASCLLTQDGYCWESHLGLGVETSASKAASKANGGGSHNGFVWWEV